MEIIIEFGLVHAFDPFKGFGFIRRKSGRDVFFHYTELKCSEHSISIGDQVSFEIIDSPKGHKARNIKRIT
jgi:CspA family cold shock protein